MLALSLTHTPPPLFFFFFLCFVSRQLVEEFSIIPSKRLRNKIAG